jgi:CheY-like chemotaxis protein
MTPEHQRAVSELLRSADKAIKDGNLDHALTAIGKVFEFDPRNVYARAYQERILSLKDSQNTARANAEKIAAENARKNQEAELQKPQPLPSPTVQNEPLRSAAEPQPTHDAGTEASQHEALPSAPGAPLQDTPVNSAPLPLTQAQTPLTLEIPVQPVSHSFDFVKHTPGLLEAYKTLLSEIWASGGTAEIEQDRIKAMRESFAITDDEHAAIEREVRIAAYLGSIEQAWKKGITNFDDMRRQFKISEQEQMQIEGRVFRHLQSLRSVGTVLFVDDDAEFLDLACREMTDAGYYCVAVPTCEEALKSLESVSPDIIVCDVNFSKPNMSGFAFYEKFRAMEKYFHVPFLFLSGMIQEAVQRTGMQMGADGYFLKPVDLELFLATIEGKIKRAHEFQQRIAPHRL